MVLEGSPWFVVLVGLNGTVKEEGTFNISIEPSEEEKKTNLWIGRRSVAVSSLVVGGINAVVAAYMSSGS